MEIKIIIEQKSLMSGIVPFERCVKLVSIMRGLRTQYCITEKGVLFTLKTPANFSLSKVDNLTDAMQFFLDGHDNEEDLRGMITSRDKPVRII